jgi:peptide deformylase
MQIVHHPHPALRRKALPLEAITDQVRKDAARMLELMYEGGGIGLAANQVDLPYRIVVLNLTGDPERPEHEQVLINPVILEREGTEEGTEGCLSLPGLVLEVTRAATLRVSARDLDGNVIDRVVTGLEARAWQHEVDHLDGTLIIDRGVPVTPAEEIEIDRADS